MRNKLEILMLWATFILALIYEALAFWFFRFGRESYHALTYYNVVFALFYLVLVALSSLSIAAIVIMVAQKIHRSKVSKKLWLVVLCNLATVINFILAMSSMSVKI